MTAPDRAQPEVDVAALLDGERWENTLDDAWPISGGRAGIVRALAGEVLDVLRDALPALLAAVEQRDALVAAVADIGVREQWPPDEWRAALAALAAAPSAPEYVVPDVPKRTPSEMVERAAPSAPDPHADARAEALVKAETTEAAAGVIEDYIWEPGDGHTVPEAEQAAYILGANDATAIGARLLRGLATAIRNGATDA